MSILQGVDPQAIEEVFGDVPNLPAGFDVEYLPVTWANVEHMAVIIQLLQEDAAKLTADAKRLAKMLENIEQYNDDDQALINKYLHLGF